jgi:hypothetical protein
MTLRRVMIGLLCAGVAYVAGFAGGAFLINQFSSNVHDRSLEAAMTGAFVIGPAVAVIAFIAALIRFRSR